MKHTKWLALVLCVAMLLLAVGCGATTTPSAAPAATKAADPAPADTADDSTEAEPAAPAVEDGPLVKYDPPIEVNVVYGTSPVQYFPEGDDYENNVWSRYFAETAGIILKVMWTADSQSTDAYTNKMSVSLASGDLPDIFTAPDYTFYKTAVDAGYAADLTEIWEKYPSDRIREDAEGFEILFEGAKVDGKLMGLPSLKYIEQQAPFLWIREDWMTKLGLSAPTTMEEMLAIAEAFTKNDPDGNGENDTYGLILQSDIFSFDFGSINGIMSGYGVPTRTGEQFYRDTDGVIKYAGIQPNAKIGLELIQKMYADGLIDPEFGVKDASKVEQDINTNKVGMGYGAEWNCWYPYATIYQTDGAVYRPYAIPAAEGYELSIGSPFPIGSFCMANSAFDHPEAMIKMLNFSGELSNEDSSEEIRATYSENEQWRFVPVRFAPPSEMLWYPVFKEAIEAGNDLSLVPKGYQATFTEMMRYEEMERADNQAQGRYWQCGPNSSLGVIYNDYMPNDVYTVSPITGVRPDSYMNLMASLNKIIIQAYTEIIMGADISKFDEFVNNWLSAGGQQVLDDLNAAYPAQ